MMPIGVRELNASTMRIALASLCLVVGVSGQAASSSWIIEPAARIGPVNRTASHQTLLAKLGEKNVQRAKIDIGEGQTEPGTVLYPEDPTRKLSILWKSSSTLSGPKTVRINSPGSKWRTPKGIGMGTSLKEIEKINGKPFVLAGFGWDYEGTILHCNGGRLSELGVEKNGDIQRSGLIVRLGPSSESQSDKTYESVIGDRRFLSAVPAMQELNPRVYEIVVLFD